MAGVARIEAPGPAITTMTKTLSPARIEANRRNAQKSTGPRTPEGKARSSRNALKHGLTARQVVLPNEDPEAFDAELAEWVEYYRPASPAERAMVERAVHAQWKLRRCARVETATLSERVRHAEQQFDLDQQALADDLGRRLSVDPLGRFYRPPSRDPALNEAMRRAEVDDPPGLARRLWSFAAGVDWLLARWNELAGALRRDGFWHTPEGYLAVRLLGRRPEDVLDDPAVARVLLACFAAHPESRDLYDDVMMTRVGVDARGVFPPRIEALRKLVPKTPAEGRDALAEMIAREVARLEALKADLLDPLAEADRAGAADRAMFDTTPAGTLFRRYETACERSYTKAATELTKSHPSAAPVRNEPIFDPSDPPESPAGDEQGEAFDSEVAGLVVRLDAERGEGVGQPDVGLAAVPGGHGPDREDLVGGEIGLPGALPGDLEVGAGGGSVRVRVPEPDAGDVQEEIRSRRKGIRTMNLASEPLVRCSERGNSVAVPTFLDPGKRN